MLGTMGCTLPTLLNSVLATTLEQVSLHSGQNKETKADPTKAAWVAGVGRGRGRCALQSLTPSCLGVGRGGWALNRFYRRKTHPDEPACCFIHSETIN